MAICERKDVWEGKAESRRTMPCDITPDSSGYPTERLFRKKIIKGDTFIKIKKVSPFSKYLKGGRGVATDSGEKPKDGD